MSNCEYFERLISDRLDSPLKAEQASALERHLSECQACREFNETVQRQRISVQNLPSQKMTGKLRLSDGRQFRNSVLTKLWRSRITVPLPAAAAVLLALIGWGILTMSYNMDLGGKAGETTPPPVTESVQVRYVRIERVEPSQPVQLRNNAEPDSKSEAL